MYFSDYIDNSEMSCKEKVNNWLNHDESIHCTYEKDTNQLLDEPVTNGNDNIIKLM